ncbi:DUF58 domain-containing protein [Fulvivirga sp. M361]|uniref:DUF58 domain-containing protein n=1 Tax=Fulvivirga sp. M361 TaxID=2594266 RepID=UPI001626DE44|nr:DUF58 domain-containing protein [Fulvivirga sp. M361]
MLSEYKELLKPEIINAIKGLELISRVITEGFLKGRNKSSNISLGQEFSQYRSYEPGDDLRLLDWKMLARSARYYIRQSELETDIAVTFILDASHSMQHTENGLSKVDYAKVLIASMAYLARHQGDSIGLWSVNDLREHKVYPRNDKQHFQRILHYLIETKAQGRWPGDAKMEPARYSSGRELVIFISDMYEHEKEHVSFLKALKTRRNEVAAIQLIGNDEWQLKYPEAVTLQDLETGEKVKIGGMREAYRSNLNEHHEKLRQTMLDNQVDYHTYSLQEPMDDVLVRFLQRRKTLL